MMMMICSDSKKMFMSKFLEFHQMTPLVHLDVGTIPEKRKRTEWSVLKGYTPMKW